MSLFDTFVGPTPTDVEIECYTSAYRVSGTMTTRFSRIADILNQLNSTHLVIRRATVSEHAAPTSTLSASQILVAVDDILFATTPGTEPTSLPEMRIEKRPVRAQLALPPFRITGSVYVTQGSRPSDSLVNASDRFLAVTDVEVSCAALEGLDRRLQAVGIQRRLAQLFLVVDDERPESLLASVLDEETAQAWATRSTPAAREPLPVTNEPPVESRSDLDELLRQLREMVVSRAPALVDRVDAIGRRNLHPTEREALRGVLLDALVEIEEAEGAEQRRAGISRLIDLVARA